MRKITFLLFLVILVCIGWWAYTTFVVRTITIGVVAELSGSLAAVGKESVNGISLAVQEINKKGGVAIGGKKYHIELVIQDNQSTISQTKKAVASLIEKNVVAIIGPNASAYAVVAGDVAEASHTVLISPWSTNPLTTLNEVGDAKKYVFRAAYLD